MDAFQRALVGNWQPHQKSRKSYRMIHANLVRAFRVSSAIARSHGATVFCSEPASEIETVLELGNAVDIAGIDLYPHMHRKMPVLDYFRWWWNTARKPLCISEFGTPETWDPMSASMRPADLSRPASMRIAFISAASCIERCTPW